MPFSRARKQRIAKRSQAGAITAVWMQRYGLQDAYMYDGLLKGYRREIEAPTGTDPEQCLDAMMCESLALPMLIAWTEEFTRWETGQRAALQHAGLVADGAVPHRQCTCAALSIRGRVAPCSPRRPGRMGASPVRGGLARDASAGEYVGLEPRHQLANVVPTNRHLREA